MQRLDVGLVTANKRYLGIAVVHRRFPEGGDSILTEYFLWLANCPSDMISQGCAHGRASAGDVIELAALRRNVAYREFFNSIK